MQTITVENEWLETAQLFGDAERVVKDALQSYFVEKSRQKIHEATEKSAGYRQNMAWITKLSKQKFKRMKVWLFGICRG